MSTIISNKKFINISWQDIDDYVVLLSKELRKLQVQHNIEKLCAITRGGLIPTALIARELDLRYIDTICAKCYLGTEAGKDLEILKMMEGDGEGVLVIDEIAETGRTIETVRKHLPKALFASVFATETGKKYVDVYLKTKADNEWLVFPWEKYDNNA